MTLLSVLSHIITSGVDKNGRPVVPYYEGSCYRSGTVGSTNNG